MNPDSRGLMLRLILSSRGRSSRVVAQSIVLGREHQFNLQFCLAGNRREYRRMVIGFEEVFARFVRSIGGEVLAPSSEEERADYLFREEKVVIELKTLEEDKRVEHAQKLGGLTTGWARSGHVRTIGRTIVNLQNMHPEPQREWLNLLEAPIERIIRKANSQIRSTKNRENLPDAEGLLLILNDGNLLHTAPIVFMNLVARVLNKRDPDDAPKFPEIRGVVYFSYRVRAAGEPNLFWVAGTIEPGKDTELVAFQARLKEEWCAYFARRTGRPVSEDPRTLQS
jgi:arsenate reductase-like glutaredoxin family protein